MRTSVVVTCAPESRRSLATSAWYEVEEVDEKRWANAQVDQGIMRSLARRIWPWEPGLVGLGEILPCRLKNPFSGLHYWSSTVVGDETA